MINFNVLVNALIIIIILAIDLYYTHEERFNEIMLFTNKETEKEGEPSEPWNKIIMGKKTKLSSIRYKNRRPRKKNKRFT